VTLSVANQVIPGDQITNVPNESTQTVIAINSDSTVVTISPGFSNNHTTGVSGCKYNGYFVRPIHDTNPTAGSVQYPGGSVLVTSNSGTDALVWGLATVGSTPPGNGALFAYDAGTMTLRCCSNSSQCTSNTSTFTTSTFALPTIVNGYAYIPTHGISISGTTYSGVVVYTGH
jgi:hypothetical protein